MNCMRAAFVLLFLSSLSFAGILWSMQSSDVPVGMLIADNKLVVSTYDGGIYALNPSTGSIIWVADAGSKIFHPPVLFGNLVAVQSGQQKIVFLSLQTGKPQQTIELENSSSFFAASPNRFFVAAGQAIFAFDQKGKLVWKKQFDFKVGPISYAEGRLYAHAGKLYSLDEKTGATFWSSDLEGELLFAPAEIDGNVYVGTSEKKIYCLNSANGAVKWQHRTSGWVAAAPISDENAVFFASTDGFVYSFSPSGMLLWKSSIGSPISSPPAIFSGGRRDSLVVASEDGTLHGLDLRQGSLLWSFSFEGRPTTPLVGQNSIIFGTSNRKIYSLQPSPSCSFTYPRKDWVMGNWTVDVQGVAYSDYPIERVEVKAGSLGWVRAKGTNSWYAPIDFSLLPADTIRLQCRVIDSSARQEGEYSSIAITVSPYTPLQKMFIESPKVVLANQNFEISAKDAEGRHLYGVRLKIDGEEKIADSPIQLSLNKKGIVQLELQKSGFEPVVLYMEAQGEEAFPFLLAFVLVVAFAAAAFAFKGKDFLSILLKK
ncbi:MAG: PQQ-binding-like beta-propeller repeat protein [Candidatus Anstonellaceae archaeon]